VFDPVPLAESKLEPETMFNPIPLSESKLEPEEELDPVSLQSELAISSFNKS